MVARMNEEQALEKAKLGTVEEMKLKLKGLKEKLATAESGEVRGLEKRIFTLEKRLLGEG
jgi:hypothetical protein